MIGTFMKKSKKEYLKIIAHAISNTWSSNIHRHCVVLFEQFFSLQNTTYKIICPLTFNI